MTFRLIGETITELSTQHIYHYTNATHVLSYWSADVAVANRGRYRNCLHSRRLRGDPYPLFVFAKSNEPSVNRFWI